MKILLVHNHYRSAGGEDQVFADEAALLTGHGHEVIKYTQHNDAIEAMGRVKAARNTVWNSQTYREVRALIKRERPALMHCTNTFPLVSPAVYYAAQAEGIAVVQSLHNYRLLCPNALFLRDGKVCEDCLTKLVPWPAVRHRCYRESRAGTAVLSGMLTFHRMLGTWRKKIDRYIVLTEFARRKFIAAGFQEDRIAVKPNFVSPDLGPGDGTGGNALFVGRLSAEKGIETLLAAWQQNVPLPPLTIIGDGPLADLVRSAARDNNSIEWLGAQRGEEVQRQMARAAMLVFPSVWYEGLPKTIVESYCRGTPVIASRIGAMAEIVKPNQTGMYFEPGNAAALASTVAELHANPTKLAAMRIAAREEFEAVYTADENYRQLISIYVDALRARGNHHAANNLSAESASHLISSSFVMSGREAQAPHLIGEGAAIL